jgi:hypothetical protein
MVTVIINVDTCSMAGRSLESLERDMIWCGAVTTLHQGRKVVTAIFSTICDFGILGPVTIEDVSVPNNKRCPPPHTHT